MQNPRGENESRLVFILLIIIPWKFSASANFPLGGQRILVASNPAAGKARSASTSYICAEIALFVLNLSDIIFLQTAPHKIVLSSLLYAVFDGKKQIFGQIKYLWFWRPNEILCNMFLTWCHKLTIRGKPGSAVRKTGKRKIEKMTKSGYSRNRDPGFQTLVIRTIGFTSLLDNRWKLCFLLSLQLLST